MNIDHDSAVADWFTRTEQLLPKRELAKSVVESVRISRRRSRLGLIAAMAVAALIASWGRSAFITAGVEASQFTSALLEALGTVLASPTCWLICVALSAALWPVLRYRN
jgi:ABC-type proline/glycine betaine transport system permease subunit